MKDFTVISLSIAEVTLVGWELEIVNEADEVVRTMSGDGWLEGMGWWGDNDDDEALPQGLYLVIVSAFDSLGQYSTSWSTISIDVTAPQIAAWSVAPAAHSYPLAGDIESRAHITDQSTLSSVTFVVTNTATGQSTVSTGAAIRLEGAWAFAPAFSFEGSQEYAIEVQAVDAAGNVRSQFVDSIQPTEVLLNPHEASVQETECTLGPIDESSQTRTAHCGPVEFDIAAGSAVISRGPSMGGLLLQYLLPVEGLEIRETGGTASMSAWPSPSGVPPLEWTQMVELPVDVAYPLSLETGSIQAPLGMEVIVEVPAHWSNASLGMDPTHTPVSPRTCFESRSEHECSPDPTTPIRGVSFDPPLTADEVLALPSLDLALQAEYDWFTSTVVNPDFSGFVVMDEFLPAPLVDNLGQRLHFKADHYLTSIDDLPAETETFMTAIGTEPHPFRLSRLMANDTARSPILSGWVLDILDLLGGRASPVYVPPPLGPDPQPLAGEEWNCFDWAPSFYTRGLHRSSNRITPTTVTCRTFRMPITT